MTIPADNRTDAGVERGVCSLTVDLRARPLSSGVFVGGADGVSDCRQRLKQKVKQAEMFR